MIMKSFFRLLFLVTCSVLLLLSCDKEKGPQIKTLSAEKGFYLIATLSGRVSGIEGISSDFECGIEYSTDDTYNSNNTSRKKNESNYTENSYKVTIYDVRPGIKYYYRAYYINQGLTFYGETKSFTFIWDIPEVSTLSAELDNETGTVILKGLIKNIGDIKNDINKNKANRYGYGNYWAQYSDCYGIEWSTNSDFINPPSSTWNSSNNSFIEDADKQYGIALYSCYEDNGDTIIRSLPFLEYGKTFFYRSFFIIGSIYNYGETKSIKLEWMDNSQVVDLGLSVKWASNNIGAQKPWDYGDYFAWGETDTYYETGYAQSSSPRWKDGKTSGYNWSSYKFGEGADHMQKHLTKYNFDEKCGVVDDKYILDLEDDAAYKYLGEGWRMPTKSEFEELIKECSWTKSILYGVNGFKVTSKKNGYKGNSIFLPAAGHRSGKSIYVGGSFSYWSNTLCSRSNPSYAYGLTFDSSDINVNSLSRCVGGTVRPVCP